MLVCEGGFYGARTKSIGALLRRSRHAAALVRHPLILTIAETILGAWCDRIILNLTQAVEIHTGAHAQAPHRDQDLWGGDKTGMEYRSEEHTSELQSLMRISYAVFCLNKKIKTS